MLQETAQGTQSTLLGAFLAFFLWHKGESKISPPLYYSSNQTSTLNGEDWPRIGFGAENVLMMKAVLADGRQAKITEDWVEIYRSDDGGAEYLERIHYTDNTDLWFALRGAGSSFAIVTEFVVTVYPRPETLPILIPVAINSAQDFANIEVNQL